MGNTLGNGGLTHTRFADKYRIVLCSARENLQHTTTLLITTNNRIEFTGSGKFIEVYRILSEGIKLLVISLRIDGRTFTKLTHRLEEFTLGNTLTFK